ncbi:hypothetical protein JCM33374_g2882 [Metschnikowia sp. JCM 33374]|nr:hypothetical protein JCM33374_g2882 [Metschnikowia sp. JCM 33374]
MTGFFLIQNTSIETAASFMPNVPRNRRCSQKFHSSGWPHVIALIVVPKCTEQKIISPAPSQKHKSALLSRTFARVARQSRPLSSSRLLFAGAKLDSKTATKLAEVTGPDSSLIGPGAQPGTIPTDVDQATGLERFELLGKMEGVDVFDMENPIFEGKGTMKDPFLVPTYIGYRYVGCRGEGAQEHKPYWMKVEEGNPGRCWQCGSVFAAKYVGEPGHNHH